MGYRATDGEGRQTGVGRQIRGEKGTVVRGVRREQVRTEMGYRSGNDKNGEKGGQMRKEMKEEGRGQMME